MAELLLEIVEGTGVATQIPVAGELELGRDPALPHALDDEQLSRRHARISAVAGGATIQDLGSTNGTYVNEQPVEGVQRLSPGDRVRVGLTVLELRTRDAVTVHGSAVRPMPPVTRIGGDVLQPASAAELAPVPAAQPEAPRLAADEREPGFIQTSAVRAGLGGDDASAPAARGGSDSPDAIARLVDTRVKRQTSIAAFALLGAAALAVAILLGVR